MGPHLDSDQIEDLLRSGGYGKQAWANTGIGENAWDHLKHCESCQKQVRAERAAMDSLNQLYPGMPTTPSAKCPAGEVWLELSAGIHPDPQPLLSHAAGCDHCGPLLNEALSDLTSGCTPEEEAQLTDLASANPGWQKDLAQSLAAIEPADSRPGSPAAAGGGADPRSRRQRIWALYAVAATVLIVLSAWVVTRRFPRASVQTLLADAYSQHRTLELRIPGAKHAPIRLERGAGSSNLDKPESLLRAEDIIAEQLRRRPDDPSFLDAKARADLIDGNFDSALQSLQRAQEAQPNSPMLKTDLATAYFARAEATGQAIDYGRAIDNLGKVLASSPGDSLALFNRAIAEERLFLYDEAAADWEHFLTVEPDPEWRDEGRHRLDDLHRKMEERKQLKIVPMRDPVAAAAILRSGRDTSGKGQNSTRAPTLDEEYLDVATTDWLRTLGSTQPTSLQAATPSAALSALQILSEELRQYHGDDWLGDLLRGSQGLAWKEGATELADAFQANATGDIGAILTHSTRSMAFFRLAGNSAGEAGAKLAYAVAMNRSERGHDCLPAAAGALAQTSHHRYPWIEVKTRYELSTCRLLNGSPTEANASAQQAVILAQQADYPELELEGQYYLDGVTTSWLASPESWGKIRNGLQTFWQAPYPPVSAANFYTDLGFAAETEELWHVGERVGQESVLMNTLDGDRVHLAAAHHWLAQVEEAAGDSSLADREYERAAAEFRSGARDSSAAKATLEIERVALEVRQGKFALAATRLDAMKPSLSGFSKEYATILYLEMRGSIDLRLGKPDEARANLQEAIRLIESNQNKLDSDTAIFGWRRTTWEAYKSLIGLYSQTYHDGDNSFALLEWSRAAALRASASRQFTLNRPAPQLPIAAYSPAHLRLKPGRALLTWMSFRNGLTLWLLDDRGVHMVWVKTPQEELETTAQSFARLCADPSSDTTLIDQEGRRLYTWLVQPVRDALRNVTTLVIEPDDLLNTVPFRAIKTATGEYLGDRFVIVESPGIGYSKLLRNDGTVSADSILLAVGNPSLDAADARRLRSLPEADVEAQEISQRFHRHSLLSGREATMGNVLRGLPGAEIFHFAGHALSRGREPGLLLASRGKEPIVLLGRAQLRPTTMPRLKLAVLSACDTATTEAGPNDPANLVLLFLEAGVPQVIASKWPVDSAASSAMMEDFYARLLRGESVDVALAFVERKMRTKTETSHPYYWAAFSEFGGLSLRDN